MPTLRTRAPRARSPPAGLLPAAHSPARGVRALAHGHARRLTPCSVPNCRPGLRSSLLVQPGPAGPGGRDWAVGWMCWGKRPADLDLVAATPSTHPLWRPALETPTPPAPRSWAEASREPLMAGRGKSRDFTHSDSLPQQLHKGGKADPTYSRTLTYPPPPLPCATLHISSSTHPCAVGAQVVTAPHFMSSGRPLHPGLASHLVGELNFGAHLSCTCMGRMTSHLPELLWGESGRTNTECKQVKHLYY